MSCSISMSDTLGPRGMCETTSMLSLPRFSASSWATAGVAGTSAATPQEGHGSK